MMKFCASIACVVMLSQPAFAATLEFTNSGRSTVIIEYIARDQLGRNRDPATVTIKPGGTGKLNLLDEDPYLVVFRTKSSGLAPGEIGATTRFASPLPLRSLAGKGPFDVRVLQVALGINERGQPVITNITEMRSKRTGASAELYRTTPGHDSLAMNVVGRKWNTTYRALDGNTYGAEVDLAGKAFRTQSFTGRFTNLTVFDDDSGAYFLGRWEAQQSRGSIAFTVRRTNPGRLSGSYTFDGRQGRYPWNSR